jgi:F0F1-type ATP synthase membrane subunit c/vacuolar-type H+-ATPase subunit K
MILPSRYLRTHRVLAALFLSGVLFLVTAGPSFAQNSQKLSSGVATMIEIGDRNVSDGDIITFTNAGYKKSTTAYDSHVFGVVTDNPQIVLENPSSKNSHAVISIGKSYVKVTTDNGPINPGDQITTSRLTGIGQKATRDGYVLGTAMESYSAKNPKQIGKIYVVLNIGFNSRATSASTNLIQNLKLAISSPEISPVNSLRYFLSAGIVIIAFIFGVAFFGRISASSLEAIGRNPLATRQIMITMIFNLTLAITIILIGIAIAYLILIL